jgi:O-acetyl-ADP-ribose deacetylase (regulator of RNase III)
MAEAWKKAFRGVPSDELEVGSGHVFDGTAADVLVSPANSFGFMNGGIDAVYTTRFGIELQEKLQARLRQQMNGECPVGDAAIVAIDGDKDFKYLVAAPTMYTPRNIAGTINVYLAFRAVLRTVGKHNQYQPSTTQIDSILCPGMGTGIGQVPYDVCAFQMRKAYDAVQNGLDFKTLEDAWRYHEGLRRGVEA